MLPHIFKCTVWPSGTRIGLDSATKKSPAILHSAEITKEARTQENTMMMMMVVPRSELPTNYNRAAFERYCWLTWDVHHVQNLRMCRLSKEQINLIGGARDTFLFSPRRMLRTPKCPRHRQERSSLCQRHTQSKCRQCRQRRRIDKMNRGITPTCVEWRSPARWRAMR
jgi:hypothetical protein